ncbi:TetR/AcrR family transcriptional regulator [Oceanimonas sp. CHS3-5]|uniref:acrylate utilization transcriptional regulator AcuR n=1 Tax=Oceanimonas sp. CHS3-5 TaxID=3068186 RepID=UPI00273E7C66|nr:TetR/AcrR family transcriptional regulator [Oceanimonas sp. CHS3-5]MDP5293224.1 TetR/AcrR family transcriptional regulator [Oceanimonas sp. CHS3-5]
MNASAPKRRGRPPRQPRDNPDTRDALIRCGVVVLTEQGFVATGIDGVLKRVGVPKGSFYHYFDSKEAFGQAVMERYAAYFAAKLDRWLLDDHTPPLLRIEHFMQDAMAGMARHDFRRGCLVGNLCQEVTILPASYRELLQAILQSWEQRLAACLQRAAERGDIAADADCERLAELFWIGWEGAVQRARIVRSNAPMALFGQEFLARLPR